MSSAAALEPDRVFAALGNATRRDLLGLAAARECSVSALARHYDVSLTAIQKHVATLERAGLLMARRSGRERLVRTDLAAVEQTRRHLEELEQLWRGRLGRFGHVLAEQTARTTTPNGAGRP